MICDNKFAAITGGTKRSYIDTGPQNTAVHDPHNHVMAMTEFEKLSALHRICFPSKPWSANDFAELKNSGAEIIMSNNSFLVYRKAADEIEIITIGVHPDMRRTLMATALLKVMENDVKKSGTHSIFLEVAETNDAAISLYEKNGYQTIGTRTGYYNGIDAITMKKEL